MKVKNKNIEKLLQKYREISLLGKINSVLGWDLNVNLPPKGAQTRAEEIAYLAQVITHKWTDPEFKSLIEGTDDSELNLEEKAILRNLKHGAHYYFKVPEKVIVEFAEVTSQAFMVWQKAKTENKFRDFAPYLKKVVDLNRKIADSLGYSKNPYDALLDLYEPELTTKDVKTIFKTLQPALTKLLKMIRKNKNYSGQKSIVGVNMNFSQELQKQVALFVLKKMNYDLEAGRMDVSSHPFTDSLGVGDVRITNRYKPHDFTESIMVALHEGGHALYEQGINPEHSGTPLEGGVSLGIHESQSRFWENQIGRSREFVEYLTPILQAFYPHQLSGVNEEQLHKLFNHVEPSLIRTEADEVTYNLHIALRFELEEALINDKIKVQDLPEIWKEKMSEYLGISPKDDASGVLQDVHWSYGSFGYFPTYTLGNLYSAQFTAAMKKKIKLESVVTAGKLDTILAWFRENIHQYGSLYWPKELVKKVTGEELNSSYFIDYLNNKYSEIYSF